MTLSSLLFTDQGGNDLSGNLNGPGTTITDAINSIYHTTWDPAGGLTPDTDYSVVAEITYNGTTYPGFESFNVNLLGVITESVKSIRADVEDVDTTMTALNTDADNVIADVASLD